MHDIHGILTVTGKDLAAEYRKRGVVNTVLLFSVLLLLVVYFSIPHDTETLHAFGPPAFWISLVFSSFLGLNHFMQTERDNNCLTALKLSPVTPWVLFAGKSLSLFLMLVLVEVILVPVFLMMFEYGLGGEFLLFLVVVMLGNFAISLCGALFSGLLISGRASAFLLPIVMIPVLLPLIISGVRASDPLLAGMADAFQQPGTPFQAVRPWLMLLLGMDFVLFSAGSFLSDTVYSA